MEPARIDVLIGGYLAGTLQEAECAELAELIRTSAEAREALIQHLMTDRLLDEGGRSPMNSDRVLEAIASAGSPEFAERVLSRVEAQRPASRRAVRQVRHDPAAFVWRLGMAAAALFATVIIVLSLATSDPAPTREKEVRRTVERAAVQAREERAQIATDLARTEEEKRNLAEELKRAEDEQKRAEVRAREADLERVAAEFRAKLEAAKEKERRATEEVVRLSPPVPAPVEKPRDPIRETQAPLATIESAQAATRAAVALAPGDSILAGDSIAVGDGGTLVVRYADKTRLELGPGTEVREFRADRGKRVTVAKGTVSADVAAQPAGQPFVFATPHGDATVVGTILRIIVDPDPKKGTRLEVTEGKVLLKSPRGKTVEVAAGHYAVAASGVELVTRISASGLAQDLLAARGGMTIKFGSPDVRMPEDVLVDAGDVFDATRGFGWSLPNGEAPGVLWQGQPMYRRKAGLPVQGARNPLTSSAMSIGWATHKETWRMPVPNGPYVVTVVVGDIGPYAQGPHHVAVEGRQIVNALVSKAGQVVEFKDIPVEVSDGELTMIVGGSGKDLDGTSDTKLCYLTIRRLKR